MTSAVFETVSIPISNASHSIAAHRYPGIGPEVVLIHGIGSSSGDFQPVIQQMGTFCRPITIDLRGHGASGKPACGYHYSDYVADLVLVLDTLNLQRPIVLGHSLGGIITMMWAAMNPDMPRALIIEDSPLRSGEDFREAFDGWLQLNALPLEVTRAWYAEKNPHWPQTVVEQRSFDMVNTARAAIEELQTASLSNEGLDSFDQLGEISVPMLFLQGGPSTGSMVNPYDLVSLQKLLPHMQQQFFPGAGHTIHRSHPQEWLQSVEDFIRHLDG